VVGLRLVCPYLGNLARRSFETIRTQHGDYPHSCNLLTNPTAFVGRSLQPLQRLVDGLRVGSCNAASGMAGEARIPGRRLRLRSRQGL
jgi:hypothetical protein